MRYLLYLFILIFVISCGSSDDSENIMHLYTPQCDANGGTFEGGNTVKDCNDLISDYDVIEIPIREGYSFSHWNYEKDGSGRIKPLYESKSDHSMYEVKIYAQWTLAEGPCDVVFEPKDWQELKIMKNLSKGTTITLPGSSDYSKAGYTLSGWVDVNEGILHTDDYTVNKNVTLFAVWENNHVDNPYSCLLQFNGNNGMISGTSFLEIDSACGLVDLPEAVRSGYTFVGWQLLLTNDSGGIIYPYPGQIEVKERFTPLRAVWK